MGVTQNYNRTKDPDVNVTGIDLSLLVGEEPDAPTAIGGTGTTAITDLRVQADADESGGLDVQDLFRVRVVPTIGNLTTKPRLTVVVTPVLGDGSDGTPQTLNVDHDELMDAWQTAAGRPRQP